jgi:hypothetical protein
LLIKLNNFIDFDEAKQKKMTFRNPQLNSFKFKIFLDNKYPKNLRPYLSSKKKSKNKRKAFNQYFDSKRRVPICFRNLFFIQKQI